MIQFYNIFATGEEGPVCPSVTVVSPTKIYERTFPSVTLHTAASGDVYKTNRVSPDSILMQQFVTPWLINIRPSLVC
jgi:hypothetical protein